MGKILSRFRVSISLKIFALLLKIYLQKTCLRQSFRVSENRNRAKNKIIVHFALQKEKTTYQKLEILEEKIKNIQAYTLSTQEQQKRFVGNLLVVSIGFYVIAFVVFYFAFFPKTWEKRLLYSIPLLLFPIM